MLFILFVSIYKFTLFNYNYIYLSISFLYLINLKTKPTEVNYIFYIKNEKNGLMN